MIVHDDHLPRGLWKLGSIQEVMVGQDGLIRGAVVRVASRDRQHLYLRRPIQLLYPLEVRCKQPSSIPESQVRIPPEEVIPDGNEQLRPNSRPKRTASKRTEELRKIWINELEENDQDSID